MIGQAIKEGPGSDMGNGPGDQCSRQTEEHIQSFSGGMSLVCSERRPMRLEPSCSWRGAQEINHGGLCRTQRGLTDSFYM